MSQRNVSSLLFTGECVEDGSEVDFHDGKAACLFVRLIRSCSFFFNLATLSRAKCKSILPPSLFALVRARVNHGKQASLFHNAAVGRSRRAARARRIGPCSCRIGVYA